MKVLPYPQEESDTAIRSVSSVFCIVNLEHIILNSY